MKKLWAAFSILVLGYSAGFVQAQTAGAASTQATSATSTSVTTTNPPALSFVQELGGVREYRLPNGLQVLLLQDSQRPAMSVNITYRVGSRHEGVGETGAAHLLEHMLFKPSGYLAGPDSAPKYSDPKTSMQALGMRWNGTTAQDRTNYFANFVTNDGKLSERLDFMLGWLSAMMTQARFTPDDLKSEMTVVRNEFERADNDASRVLGDRVRAAAYTTHGYRHPVIGTRADIENVPHARLMAFYRLHYRPDNATLILAGDFAAEDVKQRIERNFAGVEKPAAPLSNTWSTEPPQEGEKMVWLRRPGGLPSAVVAYHAPAGPTREGIAAWILAYVLGREGGPMSKGLGQQKYSVTEWAAYFGRREPSEFYAGIGLPEREEGLSDAQYDSKAQASAAALASVIESYRMTPQDFQISRTAVLASMRATLRSTESTAAMLSEFSVSDWRWLWAQIAVAEQITQDEVQAVAQRYLVASNRTTGIFVPLPEGTLATRAPATAAPSAQSMAQIITSFPAATLTALARASSAPTSSASGLDGTSAVRSDAPQFVIDHDSMLRNTRRAQLSINGQPGLQMAVMTRASKEDRVTGLLRMRWGTVDNQRNMQAIASRVGMMLTEGHLAWGPDGSKREALSQTQINERMLALDASIRISSGPGGLTANLEFPAKNTAAVLELLNGLLRYPALQPDIFERQMRASIAGLPAARSSPNSLASNLIGRNHRTHYTEDDPRAVMSQDAWDKALRAVTLAQVKEYWQRFGNAQHGEFVLSGPIDLEPVQQQLQSLWGDWASREPHARWRTEHAAPGGEAFTQLAVREKSNASYEARIAFPLHQRHEDFTALVTGVELLSRLGLWQRIREKEGLSYGVGASLGAPWDGDAAAIFINASFAPQNLAALRKAVREVLESTRERGFSASEVNQAISAIQARRKERLYNPVSAVDTIAFNISEGRPLDANKEFDARYQVLDADKVNNALRKYLDVKQLREVVAGSFDAPQ